MKREAIITALIMTFITAIAFAHGPGEGYEMGPWMMWGHGYGWFWPIIMVVFAIVVIVGIVMLIRWMAVSTDKSRSARSEESALDILKKRYAKGEIDRQEYEEKKKNLDG